MDLQMPDLRPRPTFVSPGDYRSGRGGGVQGNPSDKWYDKKALGDLPKPTPRSGQAGEPSASFSVTASQIQQQGYADDEIEYWKDATFDPPYLVHGEDDTMGQGYHHVRESTLRAYVRSVIEEMLLGEYELESEDSDVDEISAVGGGAGGSIRGYTEPVGGKKDVAEKSFGGGEYDSKKKKK
jgi:hypothetical protein